MKQLGGGLVLGKWTLKELRGRGGNGQVWLAEGFDKSQAALKILTKIKQTAYARFRDEVRTLRQNADVAGILPVLDESLPDSINALEARPWFAMPIAEPLVDAVKRLGLGMIRRAEVFVKITQTLSELHRRNLAHRDLKPSNLLWYQERACVCDFGLVTYPGKADLTGTREDIGSRWTQAPEVRRRGHHADPFPADVYALAKSLWIVLTGLQEGFEGQYATSGSLGLGHFRDRSEGHDDNFAYLGGLDALLTEATEHEPALRPTMNELGVRLSSWLKIAKSWDRSSAHNWIDLQQNLFPISVPRQTVWTAPDDIVAVLNVIGSTDSMNHMFYPDGGGMDLTSAALANTREEGCIELRSDDDVSIVRPDRLLFESFGRDSEWNYFRLETKDLEPSGAAQELNDESIHEDVTEIPDHGYANQSDWYAGSFRGLPLPEGSRFVARYFRGPFVFFQKSSSYNSRLRIPGFDVYSAMHAKMSADEFREVIEECKRLFGAKET